AMIIGALQAAHLEDELSLAVVKDAYLSASRLALVLEADASAEADDTLGESRTGDRPAGPVHFMDALVADVAVAEVPEPMPAVVHQVFVELLLARGAGPDIEIQLRRRILGFLGADIATRGPGGAGLVAKPARDEQLAIGTGLDDLRHFVPVGFGAC